MDLEKKILTRKLLLERYVRVVDDVLPLEDCNTLIDLCDSTITDKHRMERRGYPNWHQVNMNTDTPDHPLFNKLTILFQNTVDAYAEDLGDVGTYINDPEYLESLRIKRYLANGTDRFDTHVDSSKVDTCKRELAMFIYLSTNENEGWTEFDPDLSSSWKIEPKAGRLVIFPPWWMFPHRGWPVTKKNKYMLSSYLHVPPALSQTEVEKRITNGLQS